jgi:hypothetical protein
MENVSDLIDNTLDKEYKLNPTTILEDVENTKLFIVLENRIWSILFNLMRTNKI